MTSQEKDTQFVRFQPWLKASATVEKGTRRKNMEDRIVMSSFEFNGKTYYIFLLLDGHGGSEVVNFVQANFADILGRHVIDLNGYNTREAIRRAFVDVDSRVKHMHSGTTASLLLVVDDPNQIWLANVGDSTVYGITENKEKQKQKKKQKSHGKERKKGKTKSGSRSEGVVVRKISTDHNVKYRSEKKRVDEAESYTIRNGYVCTEDGHMLAVTRALGDSDFGHVITPEPTIKRIRSPYSIFVIASDGIWDVMDGRALWEKLHPPRERIAWRQSAYRINRWRNETYAQHDNTSLILVYLNRQKWNSGRQKHSPSVAKVGRSHLSSDPSSISVDQKHESSEPENEEQLEAGRIHNMTTTTMPMPVAAEPLSSPPPPTALLGSDQK